MGAFNNAARFTLEAVRIRIRYREILEISSIPLIFPTLVNAKPIPIKVAIRIFQMLASMKPMRGSTVDRYWDTVETIMPMPRISIRSK